MSLLDLLEDLRKIERELDEAELDRLRARARVREADFRRKECRKMIAASLAALGATAEELGWLAKR